MTCNRNISQRAPNSIYYKTSTETQGPCCYHQDYQQWNFAQRFGASKARSSLFGVKIRWPTPLFCHDFFYPRNAFSMERFQYHSKEARWPIVTVSSSKDVCRGPKDPWHISIRNQELHQTKFLCRWPDDVELTTETSAWFCSHQLHLWTFT